MAGIVNENTPLLAGLQPLGSIVSSSSSKSKLQRTTLLLGNLHCPSCVSSVTRLLTSPPLSLPPSTLSISLLTSLVSFSHPPDLLPTIKSTLREAGFTLAPDDDAPSRPETARRWFESHKAMERREEREEEEEQRRAEKHRLSCAACREDGRGKGRECVVSIGAGGAGERVTQLAVGGMTCASCVGAVKNILRPEADSRIKEVEVTLLPGRAVVRHDKALDDEELVRLLDEGGYVAEVVESRDVVPEAKEWVETKMVIEGMTCSSCVSSMNTILNTDSNPAIRSAMVTLLPPLAVVVHNPSLLSKEQLVSEITDGGYGAEIISSSPVSAPDTSSTSERTVKLRIDGFFCSNCSTAVNSLLSSLVSSGSLHVFTPLTVASPITTLTYTSSPTFSLRTLRSLITALGPFTLTPLHTSSTLSTLSAASQARESRHLLLLLLLTIVFAIPTFLIGILAMTLLPSSSPLAHYFDMPLWGSASRGTVALFALATPVQFGIGSFFYARAWKGVRGVWRRGGKGKWKTRLLRWGSMDSLVAIGTTAGWAASFAFMVNDIRTPPVEGEMGGEMGYFDSSVFLMLFILLGRYLEAVSKKRTGDAVEALGSMKPLEGILYTGSSSSSLSPSSDLSSSTTSELIDFLEIGDTILIPVGSSVPLDCTLLPSSPSSSFDESSLTGESLPILKAPLDPLFASSTNLGPSAVVARISAHAGSTLLDGIVGAVREAMSRKAGIEKLADEITGYFVPAIVAIAGVTFGAWVVRGYAGGCPEEWLEGQGGWALFAVQFAVAVLVVACPCGIGLAAPTAQMVGTGIAARLGIVPYGGGEAFQNATKIDCIVFDKTGTITRGEFRVSNHELFDLPASLDTLASPATLWRALNAVEEASAHPISTGVRAFCQAQISSTTSSTSLHLLTSEEIPGRGLSATVIVDTAQVEFLVGNELLMSDHQATYGSDSDLSRSKSLVERWGSSGQSLAFVAVRQLPSSGFRIIGLFAVSDPPRKEAAYVVTELEKQGIAVYMCTGDNRATALAVARSVGIVEERVFAGVLPVGKQECIERLQRGGAADGIKAVRGRGSWWQRRKWARADRSRAKVMFVGDGINDIVALTQADVGVSMGSGAAVALTSSEFCLLSSNLLSLLSLLALSRATFNKILSNFFWATGFNTILIPVAAGAFYDFGKTRLPPVWAALAMALSSVSVVVNSLLLRSMFRVPAAVRDFDKLQ